MGTSLPGFSSLTRLRVRLREVGSLCTPHCLTACGLASTALFPRQLCPVSGAVPDDLGKAGLAILSHRAELPEAQATGLPP